MKNILYIWDSSTGCHGPSVPSPIPPWQRPISNPRTNSMAVSGTLDLTYDTTYFDNDVSNNDGGDPPVDTPWEIILPNGNYKRQIIRLYIPGKNLATSPATFVVTGTIAGFTTLTFDSVGFSAVLEWDGDSTSGTWQLIGGGQNQG